MDQMRGCVVLLTSSIMAALSHCNIRAQRMKRDSNNNQYDEFRTTRDVLILFC
jgi:hypothetical protein